MVFVRLKYGNGLTVWASGLIVFSYAITTAIYLILGWAIVFDFQSFTGIPVNCLMMIAAGGIAYSIGAFIYIFKKPNLTENFGFHELFHIFVMLGSLLHYLAILMFIL